MGRGQSAFRGDFLISGSKKTREIVKVIYKDPVFDLLTPWKAVNLLFFLLTRVQRMLTSVGMVSLDQLQVAAALLPLPLFWHPQPSESLKSPIELPSSSTTWIRNSERSRPH